MVCVCVCVCVCGEGALSLRIECFMVIKKFKKMLHCVIHFQRAESFARKKIRGSFGINFHEWQDCTRFPKNKLSRIDRNQILQVHKFSRG